jgi:hypothetical protein
VRSLAGRTQIDLRHLIAADTAGVAQLEAHVETTVAGEDGLEFRVGKGGVRETVSERKQRRNYLSNQR